MVMIGESKEKGYSAMAVTVGFTSALAARLILEGKIKQRGVLSPLEPEIYEPIL